MPKLFLLMLVMTVAEIYVLITIGGLIGTLPTLLLIIATAFIGSWQIRKQGMMELRNAVSMRNRADQVVLSGLMLVIAGVLLVTPGFITDAIGLSLLIPSVRKRISSVIKSRGAVFIKTQMYTGESNPGDAFNSKNHPDEPTVIDGEFERENDKK